MFGHLVTQYFAPMWQSVFFPLLRKKYNGNGKVFVCTLMQMLDSKWHDWSSLLQLTWYGWEENPVILFWPHALNPGSCCFHWCHKTIYLHAFHFSLKESKKETVTTKTCLQVSRWGKYIQKGTIYFVSCAALSVNFINCFPICMCKIQLKVDKGSFTKLAEKKKKAPNLLYMWNHFFWKGIASTCN